LINKAKEKGIIVSLTTNGSYPVEKAKTLLGADIILVSIDGPQEYHDHMRNTPGAFKKAIEFLHFLKANEKKPLITTVYAQETSFDMLEELINLAKDMETRITIKNMGRNINADIKKDQGSLEYNNIASGYFHNYMKTVSALREKYSRIVVNPEPLVTVIKRGGLDIYGCRAMDIAVCIKADGSVSLPCNGLSVKLFKGQLKEAYYSKETIDLRAVQGRHTVCKGCNIPCMVQASALLKVSGLFAILKTYKENI